MREENTAKGNSPKHYEMKVYKRERANKKKRKRKVFLGGEENDRDKYMEKEATRDRDR